MVEPRELTAPSVEMVQFQEALESVYEWIERVKNPDDENFSEMNFVWLYPHYRQLEGLVKLLTDELSEEQWDKIEEVRKVCEELRRIYKPNFITANPEQ